MDNNDIKEEIDEEIVSVGLKATFYNSLIDRFFYKIYINKNEDNEQYIFIHSNGIVLCGLGSNNKLVKNRNILEVVDLGKLVQVKGKRKHGAKILQENETVLEFKLSNNESLSANAEPNLRFSPKINKAKLMEINNNIINDPCIIFDSPEKFGYLCMLFIDQQAVENLKSKYES